MKFTSKSQSAVFKENRRPCAPGGQRALPGPSRAGPAVGGMRRAAGRGYARMMIPTASPKPGEGKGGELCARMGVG